MHWRGSQGRIHKGLGRGGCQQHMAPNRRVGKEGNTLDGQLASGDHFLGCKKVRSKSATKRGERSDVRQSCSKEINVKGGKRTLFPLAAHHKTLSSVQTLCGTAPYTTKNTGVKGFAKVFWGGRHGGQTS